MFRKMEPWTQPVLHQQSGDHGHMDGTHDHVCHAQGGQDDGLHAAILQVSNVLSHSCQDHCPPDLGCLSNDLILYQLLQQGCL